MSTSILLPDDLHADLKAIAEREQRSLHRQIIWILQRYRDEQRESRETERDEREGER